MKFTGERYIPSEQGQIRLEHYHRYASILKIIAEKDVLDLACGEGYGSYLMSKHAARVVGADISKETIKHAKANYKNSNLSYVTCDASKLIFPSNSFEVVASFETIEHLTEQEAMLSEIRRVLRPGGILLISSPNKPVYSAENADNEFHVKELDFDEFDTLLRGVFPYVDFFGQRLMMGSVIQPLHSAHKTAKIWSDDGTQIINKSSPIEDPTYFIAVCAEKKSSLKKLEMSTLYPTSLDLVKHYVGFAKWAKVLDSTVADRDAQIASLNQSVSDREEQIRTRDATVADRDAQIASLNQSVSDREEQIRTLDATVADRDAQIASLNQSVSDREEQIRTLDATVADRDAQIASLNQSVSDREEQIRTRDATVADRDAQITSLNQSVSDREEQIRTRDATVADRDAQIASLNQSVSDREEQIRTLDATVADRDAQITSLNQSVSDREEQIRTRDATVADRDAQIASLNQSVSDREEQIRTLDATVADRDAQITSLNQSVSDREEQIRTRDATVADRDAQIASLNQSVSDREEQIRTLDATVADRDAQITSLNQSVSDREEQIRTLTDETVRRGQWALGLDAQLKEEQSKLMALTRSNSWRITLPLREARRWLTSPIVQTKRYAKGVLRFTRRMYRTLPLSVQTKSRHRLWISRISARILLASRSHSLTIPELSIPQLASNREGTKASEGQGILASDISISMSDNPLVSIIIPIYGKLDYTLRCLASIAAHPPLGAFEVIVVDDCSPDDSWEVLNQKVNGIRIMRHDHNQGFIRSCNSGAKKAKGQYLYFLNNDTELTEGCVDALVRTFSDFPGTGLVGSKLVYPDGRLQEAGGIIWQDGSAWNFGRFQNPQLPVYNYAREVDYCSGASIMVPKSLFEELGGFDEHYVPAYCEDSDLALKIRDKGYRVIYQPLSTVIHFEGVTSGTDTSQGVKAYQVENAKKLFERWQGRLKNHQSPGKDVDSAKDRKATRRVLVLDHCTPTPDQDAGSVTVFNLLLLLREMDFQVTFIPEDNFLYMPEYTTALQAVGIEVLYAPHYTSVAQHLKESGQRYDLAFLFRPGVVERYLRDIRKYCPEAKVLYHTVDLHFLRMTREAELLNDSLKLKQAEDMKRRELAAIQSCDASIVHSTAEFGLLRPELPGAKLHVFPLIMNVRGTRVGFQKRQDLVFVGGYQHTPNVDAVKYFAEEVMPLLRKQLSGVRFYAVGSKPPAEIKALKSEDIIITGFVEDLTPLLEKMRVSVAPLRYGAGIKGKIGTAMAVGLPVVATSLAIEGMSLTDDENILVADGAAALAEAIARIYQDEALWNRVSKNGLVFAEQVWGAEAAWGIFAGILADVGIQVRRDAHPLALYSEPPHTTRGQHKILRPIGSAESRQEYLELLEKPSLRKISQIEKQLLVQANSETFAVDGFCVPCDKEVSFLVDMQAGGQRHAKGWTPNWRERLECPLCRMNNRQRLMATLVKQVLSAKPAQQVYFMEQVTPIFNWAMATFKQHTIIGSEYLGHEYVGGTTINGIRHEDVEHLSFSNEQFDLIVSNDVFEHVPNPAKAFAECARVLKAGGVMLATFPFHSDKDESVIRARLNSGQLENILPPAFHGNPVSAEGSLVFTDFGWDFLDVIREAGFSNVTVDVYASPEFVHLGGGQLVFKANK